jgi:hypothetical protein
MAVLFPAYSAALSCCIDLTLHIAHYFGHGGLDNEVCSGVGWRIIAQSMEYESGSRSKMEIGELQEDGRRLKAT